MVVMRIQGGFASQLSKYILGYAVAKIKKTEYKIDIHDYAEGYFRPFVLQLLDIDDVECIIGGIESLQIKEIADGEKLVNYIQSADTYDVYLDKENVDYKLFYERYKNEYETIEKSILSKITMINNTYVEKFFADKNDVYVAVHVRRGDFVTLNWDDDIDNYKSGIGIVRHKYPNCKFLFFSNDMKWTKQTFGKNNDFIYMPEREGYDADVEDFFIMAQCDIKIIASNSGYSKYAYYLGKAKYDFDEVYYIGQQNENVNEYIILDEKEKKTGLNYYYKYYDANTVVEDEINILDITRKEAVILENVDNRKIEFWSKYYMIKNKDLDEKKIVVITNENRDIWKINNAFLVAAILARLGKNVEYIKMCINPFGVDFDSHIAKDMDGNSLGFKTKNISVLNILETFKEIKGKRLVFIFNNPYLKRIYSLVKKQKVKSINIKNIKKPDDIYRISEEQSVKIIRKKYNIRRIV